MTRKELHDWIKMIEDKNKNAPVLVDFTTHVPTTEELNNLCYLSMKYVIGWQMRAVDFSVVMMMSGTATTVNDLDNSFIPALAEYMWDHLMSEPDEISSEDLEKAIKAVRDMLYGMDENTRNDMTK
jgi:hypothetical protein